MRKIKKWLSVGICLAVGMATLGFGSCVFAAGVGAGIATKDFVDGFVSGFNAPHEHQWDEGEVSIEPTCEQNGKKVYTCSCGETVTAVILALGHTFTDYISN